MMIPVGAPDACDPAWPALDPAAKRERLLAAAAGVFAAHGLEAPMSDVADAAGAGVASVYRIFPSKRELLAALVVRRLDDIHDVARAAHRHEGTRWAALTAMLMTLAASVDDFVSEARVTVTDHPGVVAARARAWAAVGEVLDAARAEGRLRPDATTLDLRLLFAATRAARGVEPDGWRRMLELMIDALDSQRPTQEPD